MNRDIPPTIRVSDPANLLALIPYLLGFQPRQSLIVMALHDHQLRMLARQDLPAAPEDHDPVRAGLDHLAAALIRNAATETILIGYGSAAPVTTAVEVATAVLTAAGLPVLDALRVDEGRYYGLACTNPQCCPADGTPFDPAGTLAAATAAYIGLTAAADRDQVMARLAPITGAARSAFADATADACQHLLAHFEAATGQQPGSQPDTSPETDPGHTLLQHGQRAFDDAIASYRQGQPLDDPAAAELTVLLNLDSVRHHAFGQLTAARWQLEMWCDLVRRAEPEFVAEPANLLTIAALLSGDGVLATLASTRARNADPGNTLAKFLRQVISAGVSPDEIKTITAQLSEPDPDTATGGPSTN